MKKINYKSHRWFDGTLIIILFITILGFPSSFIGLFFATPFIFLHFRKSRENKKALQKINDLDLLYEKKLQILSDVENQIKNKENIFESEKDLYKKELFKSLEDELTTLKTKINSTKLDLEKIVANKEKEKEKIIKEASDNLVTILDDIKNYSEERELLSTETEKLRKQVVRQTNIIKRAKYEIQSLKQFNEHFPQALNEDILSKGIDSLLEVFNESSVFESIVDLDLHHKDSKALRRQMNAKKRTLKKLLENYSGHYTTKSNRAIYLLMTIGIQAELQNILYSLTFSKLDEAKEDVRTVIREYLAIAGDGNRTILPTISRFLTELEPLMLDMVEVEYTFYHKREQEREEQRAIREQMREDAAERKLLKAEQKKIELEEAKFEKELDRHKVLLEQESNQTEIESLLKKIEELESQQKQLSIEKDDIISRANGKAGYVYVISNLGAFGNNMFKIGMTRRMEPYDRIAELSSASVPFKFDVHAMIFSKDAVGLENRLHEILDKQRVNKVNMRKEFFHTNINDLQEIVEDIDATVEFKKTLLAQEYNESLEILNKQNSTA